MAKVIQAFEWSVTLRMLLEGCLEFSLAVFLQLYRISFSNYYVSVSSVGAVLGLIFLVGFPFWQMTLSNSSRFGEHAFMEKVEGLYEDFTTKSFFSKKTDTDMIRCAVLEIRRSAYVSFFKEPNISYQKSNP